MSERDKETTSNKEGERGVNRKEKKIENKEGGIE